MFYRDLGDIPRHRQTRMRDADGRLHYEELMGEEGFSSDSSLLYHREIPSAIVATATWELTDQATVPNHPLRPLHFTPHDLFRDGQHDVTDAVTGRRLVLGNGDVRIPYVVAGAVSPYYRYAHGDDRLHLRAGPGTANPVFRPPPNRH